MQTELSCRKLIDRAELAGSICLMTVLRPETVKIETYERDFQEQMAQGYELHGCFSGDTCVGLAGIRRQRTMSRGWHLFVDDLVTDPKWLGRDVGTHLIEYLKGLARGEGFSRIYLDSRATAKGFYEKKGFIFLTSVPCFVEVE